MIHLHSQTNEPQVSDLGFSLSPGGHDLASVTYQHSISLPDPWGECVNQTIEYFPDSPYSQHRCHVQHITKELYSICGCVESWMPGSHPLCNITQYMDCLTTNYRAQMTPRSDDSCPNACDLESYRVDLSGSDISRQGIDVMLGDKKTQTLTKFREISDIGERTNNHRMAEVVQLLSFIIESRKDFSSFVDVFLTSKMTSIPNFINEAVQELDILIMDSLSSRIMVNLTWYHDVYGAEIKPVLTSANDAIVSLSTHLAIFSKGLGRLSNTNLPEDFFSWLKERSRLTEASLNDAINIWYIFSEPEELADDDGRPLTLIAGSDMTKNCSSSKKSIQTMLVLDLKNALQDVNLYLRSNNDNGVPSGNISSSKEFKSSVSNLKNVFLRFQRHVTVFSYCNEEYEKFLLDAIEWKTQLQNVTFSSKHADFADILSDLESDKDTLNDLLWQYVNNMIPKYELANHLIDNKSFLAHVEDAKDFAHEMAIHVLQSDLNLAESELLEKLLRGLEIYERIYRYFQLEYLTENARSLDLWRQPFPNLDSAEIISYRLNPDEIWRIWPQGQSLSVFMAMAGTAQAESVINDYFAELRKILTKIGNDLEEKYARVRDFTFTLNERLAEYNSSLMAEDRFVMNNFLRVDIFFGELKYEKVEQLRAYDTPTFFSDVGGFMGLLVGGSVISVFEFLDFIVHFWILKWRRRGRSNVTTDTVPRHDQRSPYRSDKKCAGTGQPV